MAKQTLVAKRTFVVKGTRMAKRTAPRKRVARMHVGDVGVLRLGKRGIKVCVIEDRGFIGKNGRQLVRVLRVGRRKDGEQPFELPAEELGLSASKCR